MPLIGSLFLFGEMVTYLEAQKKTGGKKIWVEMGN